jgi:hypothetical protein
MANADEWHKLGDHYAPKESWQALFDEEPRVGLLTLTVTGHRKASKSDRTQITIEPSTKIKQWGVFINVHQHYELEGTEDAQRSSRLLSEVISESWDDFLKYRDNACEHIFAQAFKG